MARLHDDPLRREGRARGAPGGVFAISEGGVTHATWRACQKDTTRSAVEGIRRAKLTRALSMSEGDGTRFWPSRSRINARTVAHSRAITLPTIRIGS